MNRAVVATTPTTRPSGAVGRRSASSSRYTRRAVFGSALAASALLACSAKNTHAAGSETEETPELWRTWLLTAGDELRPLEPAPPTPDEFSELIELQGQRSA